MLNSLIVNNYVGTKSISVLNSFIIHNTVGVLTSFIVHNTFGTQSVLVLNTFILLRKVDTQPTSVGIAVSGVRAQFTSGPNF